MAVEKTSISRWRLEGVASGLQLLYLVANCCQPFDPALIFRRVIMRVVFLFPVQVVGVVDRVQLFIQGFEPGLALIH